MYSTKALLSAVLLASLAVALPAPAASTPAPAPTSTTCGSNKYTAAQIQSAAAAACKYYKAGTTAGGSTYPHQYNDYEGFKFGGIQGPYQEFPMLESGVYNGGSPGADRVIINESCELAGEITHTGASGNDFVGCSGTS